MSQRAATHRLVLTGVGGQGVITAARMLGDAAMESGFDVRVSQLHGMSQRGGSVEAMVLIGPGSTGFVSEGEADVVVGFEPLEAARAIPRMSSRTFVVINTGHVVPFSMTSRGRPYPPLSKITGRIGMVASRVVTLDGLALAREAGDERCLNVVMLGALAANGVLPFDARAVAAAVGRRSPKVALEANLRAFWRGAGAMDSKAEVMQ